MNDTPVERLRLYPYSPKEFVAPLKLIGVLLLAIISSMASLPFPGRAMNTISTISKSEEQFPCASGTALNSPSCVENLSALPAIGREPHIYSYNVGVAVEH